MKVLITGVEGKLGYDLLRESIKRGITAVCPNFLEMDITNFQQVSNMINNTKPEVVIHCAGWTAVDLAEEKENIEKVRDVNVNGTYNIAKACKESNIKMVYISTDYVFDGSGSKPWVADSGAYLPLSVYGLTKLEGEIVVKSMLDKYFIIRISWLFGINGGNFVDSIIRASRKTDQLPVVNDQIGNPTYTVDLSKLIIDMIQSEKYGVYHATNEGDYISWYDFASEILRQTNSNTRVIPVNTVEYTSSKARRPLNSRLDKTKLTENGFSVLPDWKDALKRYLIEYFEKENERVK